MADKIRVNYAALDDMAKQLDMVTSRLTELAGTASKISQQMQGGVLQGQPGDAFEASLGVLAVKVKALADKVTTQANGIRSAEADMRQADTNAAGDFK